MKVDTGIGALDVPPSVQKHFLAWCKTEGMKPEDIDFEKDYLWAAIGDADGKLLTEDEARFFAKYLAEDVPPEGGYPIWKELKFSVGNADYGVIACGWTSELEDKRPLHMFAFKHSAKTKRA